MKTVTPADTPTVVVSAARFAAFRLLPGTDVLDGLRVVMQAHGFKAAFVAGCVGSLSRAQLRYAGVSRGTDLVGDMEIVSLIGTLDSAGEHLHLAVADAHGVTSGGHVLPGCLVRTTLELVIGELPECEFLRRPCERSGYDELCVVSATPNPATK